MGDKSELAHKEDPSQAGVFRSALYKMLAFTSLLYLILAFCTVERVFAISGPDTAELPDLYEASIAELQDGLQKGHFTSVDLVKVSTPYTTETDMSCLVMNRHTLLGLKRSTTREPIFTPSSRRTPVPSRRRLN